MVMRRSRLPRYVQEQRIERDLQTIYQFMLLAEETYLYLA